MSEGETDKGAAAKAQELKEAITKLEMRDKVIFLASAALVLLFFLPWWRMDVQILGSTDSASANGLHGAGWIGFLAACLTTAAGLTNMGFVPLSAELKAMARKTVVQLGLSGVALVLGPIAFWSDYGDHVMAGPFGHAGKTLFFWLAFLAAAAAAGCAGWKFADERKAAGSTPPG